MRDSILPCPPPSPCHRGGISTASSRASSSAQAMAASDVVEDEPEGEACVLDRWEVEGRGFHRTWKASVRCRAAKEAPQLVVSGNRKHCIYAVLQPLPKELYADDFELLRGMRSSQMAQGCGDAAIEVPAHLATSCHLSSYSGNASWDAAWPIHARYPAPGSGSRTVMLHRPLAMIDCGQGWRRVPLKGHLRPSPWTVPGCGDSFGNLVVAVTLLCNFLGALWITDRCDEKKVVTREPSSVKETPGRNTPNSSARLAGAWDGR